MVQQETQHSEVVRVQQCSKRTSQLRRVLACHDPTHPHHWIFLHQGSCLPWSCLVRVSTALHRRICYSSKFQKCGLLTHGARDCCRTISYWLQAVENVLLK